MDPLPSSLERNQRSLVDRTVTLEVVIPEGENISPTRSRLQIVVDELQSEAN